MTGPEAHRLYQDSLEAARYIGSAGFSSFEDLEEVEENLRQARAAMEFASFNHNRPR